MLAWPLCLGQGDFYLGEASHLVPQEENDAQEDGDNRSFESIDVDRLSFLAEGRFENNEVGFKFVLARKYHCRLLDSLMLKIWQGWE
jgi:hypothetical protein